MCDSCSRYEDAIINQHIDCIKRLQNENIEYDKSAGYCSMAAFSGHLEILQYLIDNFENDLSEPVCNYAVIGGSLCCLIAAHIGGFVMNSNEITQNAALRGDVSCLRYAVSNGCRCDQNICEYAVSKDSLICLVYLLNQGYVCTELACIRALLNGRNSDCYVYMISHGLCEHDQLQPYSNLSLAQAISRYYRRRSYDFLSLNNTNQESSNNIIIQRDYIRSWRNNRNNNLIYDEIVGR